MLLVIQIFLSGINNPSMIVLYTHVTSVTMLLAIKAILSSIKIQLEGIANPCDQCDYVGNHKSFLKTHEKSNVSQPC